MLWLYGTGQEIPAYAGMTVEVDCWFYGINRKNHVFIVPSFPHIREFPELRNGIYDANILNNDFMIWLNGVGQEIPAYAGMTVEKQQ